MAKKKMGPRPKLKTSDVKKAVKQLAAGVSKKRIALDLKISFPTLLKYLREYEATVNVKNVE